MIAPRIGCPCFAVRAQAHGSCPAREADVSHVWMAPAWQGGGDLWRLVGCGHVFGVSSAVISARPDEHPREAGVPINGTRFVRSGSNGVCLPCIRQCAIISLCPCHSVQAAIGPEFIALTSPARLRRFSAWPRSHAPCGWRVRWPQPSPASSPACVPANPPPGQPFFGPRSLPWPRG